jgi:predicted small lipoprotein YifL
MRAAALLVSMTVLAGCGQTGSLYLPDKSVETPVEIRNPADIEKEKKDQKPAPPPGR